MDKLKDKTTPDKDSADSKENSKASEEVSADRHSDTTEAVDGETKPRLDLSLDMLPSVTGSSGDQSDSSDTSESAGPESTSKSLARLDPLQQYMREIRSVATLSREEEHELAVKFKESGDRNAAYQLVLANLRLVVMIAREYQRNAQNVLDLVQEGNIGLLEAVNKYDPLRGVRFPSYAVYWIRAYMLRYLIQNVRLVKVGTTQAQRKLFFNLVKEKDKLEREGFAPEAKLLATRLNVKESEVIEMEQRLALPDLSVDAPVGKNEDASDWHGLLPDQAANAEEQVLDEQFRLSLNEAMESFKEQADEKEKAILERRLFTEDPETLQAIASEFDVSRERIRQVEARLKIRLKEFLADRLGLDEDGQIEIGGE
jgi:RNA polymerase sigma-32 factor